MTQTEHQNTIQKNGIMIHLDVQIIFLSEKKKDQRKNLRDKK